MGLVDIFRSARSLDDRDFCIASIETELTRFYTHFQNKEKPRIASYRKAIKDGKRYLFLYDKGLFQFVRTRALKRAWLDLLGFRFSVEQSVSIGGMLYARQRAAEILSISEHDIKSWSIDYIFNVFVFSQIADEWKYDQTWFRIDDYRCRDLPFVGHGDFYDRLSERGKGKAA